MRLKSFRICNFRSIIDINWNDISFDGITALIGQNEAGKTALIDAFKCFKTGNIEEDDRRNLEETPEVSCSFIITKEEFNEHFGELTIPIGAEKLILEKLKISITKRWEISRGLETVLSDTDLAKCFPIEETEERKQAKIELEASSKNVDVAEKRMVKLQANLETKKQALKDSTEDKQQSFEEAFNSASDAVKEQEILLVEAHEIFKTLKEKFSITAIEFIIHLEKILPTFEFFIDFSSLLPRTIDLEDLQNNNEKVQGFNGAKNLLQVAGIDFNSIKTDNIRFTENALENINTKFTANFQEFWQQIIGKNNQVEIEIQLKNHDNKVPEKAGKPYFVFWIKDKKTKLYPEQRSKGFCGFYPFI